MQQDEKLFSGKDRILMPLFFLSLLLSAFIIGDLVLICVLLFIAFLVLSLVYSIISLHSFSLPKLAYVIRTKESAYALSFSVLATLAFMAALPYLLFHEAFLNWFVIQYIYTFPVMLFFFTALFVFGCLLKGEAVRYWHIIKVSLIISVSLSLILSAAYIFLINYTYDAYSKKQLYYYSDSSIWSKRVYERYGSMEDLPVVREIKGHYTETLEFSYKKQKEFRKFNSDNGFCIARDCVKALFDASYYIVKTEIDKGLTLGALSSANKTLEYINSGEFATNFSTLDNYSAELNKKIDSYNFTLPELRKEEREALIMVDKELTYSELKELLENPYKSQDAGSPAPVYSGLLSLFSNDDSLLLRSSLFVFRHSTEYRELSRLSIRVSIYTIQQVRRSDIFVELYRNKDIEEPVKSKVVRYKIILDNIEQHKRRFSS